MIINSNKREIKYVKKVLAMRLLSKKYGVCRLNNKVSIPEWAKEGKFFFYNKNLK
jgi:hypothetical protein